MSRYLWQTPQAPGAYRWFYADATCGEFTAVAIFMVGAVFSPRYVGAEERGERPDTHCAVNFALYQKGRGVFWTFSHYGALQRDEDTLRIGRSTWRWQSDGGVRIDVDERSAVFGTDRLTARLSLSPDSPGPLMPLPLGSGHLWQPLAPRCSARLAVSSRGIDEHGHGYADTNHGEEPLGVSLPGWHWTRVHAEERTHIHYALPGPHSYMVTAERDRLWYEQVPSEETPSLEATRWGLRVPRSFRVGDAPNAVFAPARLLESSPFYARLEAHAPGAHALGEVADFRRFRSPWIRWMAHFRTRVEGRS